MFERADQMLLERKKNQWRLLSVLYPVMVVGADYDDAESIVRRISENFMIRLRWTARRAYVWIIRFIPSILWMRNDEE